MKTNQKFIYASIILMALMALALITKCNDKPIQTALNTAKTDSLVNVISKQKRLLAYNDSVYNANKRIDTVYITKWKKNIVRITQTAPDTCKEYIDSLTVYYSNIDSVLVKEIKDITALYNGCKSILKTNDTLNLILIKDNRALNDSISYLHKDYNAKIEKQRFKGRLLASLSSLGSIFVGFGIGSVAR